MTEPIKLPPLPAGWEAELLDWVSACQSAYHIDNTPGHRFGGLGSNLEENRSEIVCFVRGLIESHATAAIEADRQARGEPVARVNNDGFIVETGLGLAPGTLLFTAPQPQQQAGEAVLPGRVCGYTPGQSRVEIQMPSGTAMTGLLELGSEVFISAAPQPPQIPEDFVDKLAQEIRRVDGNHSLGAAALAERLVPFLSRTLFEAAPDGQEFRSLKES